MYNHLMFRAVKYKIQWVAILGNHEHESTFNNRSLRRCRPCFWAEFPKHVWSFQSKDDRRYVYWLVLEILVYNDGERWDKIRGESRDGESDRERSSKERDMRDREKSRDRERWERRRSSRSRREKRNSSRLRREERRSSSRPRIACYNYQDFKYLSDLCPLQR